MGGNTVPRNDNSNKIKWIGRRKVKIVLTGSGIPTDGPQSFYRFGKGKLLSGKAIDETPAPHLPAPFHFSILRQQLTPCHGQRFTLQHITEYDPVAARQLARNEHRLDVFRRAHRGGAGARDGIAGRLQASF